ncbi:DUF262 domain-containing protein [Bacillus pacificus]|uniref:DUF262 domain-containing protein n=1 Tax=Bacillus pacificus TaxID=2026187 RepID=UPI00111FDB93|nr:DUF262 domain-containing protein [Bacillus pacificus]TNP01438.1 DUF262 domain-containing protein [Bacillus pacificus]
MTIKKFNFYTVEQFLISDKFYIPDYQREYSWEKSEQIKDFWLDLVDLVENNRDSHFFGQVVIHDDNDDKKKYIIDGQQRSSTSIIFLAVVRQLFDEIYTETKKDGARNKVEDIRLKIIGRWSEEENELQFHLGKIDNLFFRDCIQRGVPFPEELTEPSHSRIKDAYEYLYKELTLKLEGLSYDDKYNKLVEYYNGFKNSFSLMCVETDDMNEAFIIFETLNARGKELETSDLLKNHLFKTSNGSIDEVKSEWLKMQENADGIDLTRYIRTIWNSKYEFTREKELYKNLKEEITTPTDCLKFTKELVKSISTYKVLVDPINEAYFKDKEIEKHIESLKLLNASTYHPIVIAMANSSYDEVEIKKVVEAIESFIVRNCVIAGKVANRYEILFAKLAQKISGSRLTFEEIAQELKNDMLSDDEFENYFMACSIKSAPVAKFILRKINDFQQKEMVVNPSDMKIHLEHIMPKKLGNWKVHEDIHQKYLHRIGNLTLLADEYNKSIKNKEFIEKKKVYNKSKIEMTKKLVSYNEWTSTRIDERQKELYDVARQIWINFV